MNATDQTIALELKKKISEKIKLDDFRVFGSRASGNNDPDSDMDVFIQVSKLDRATKEDIYEIAWEVGFHNNVVISPLICSTEEVINSPLRVSPIIKNIHESGISL
jgi:predicted nucleotidyltransferase